MSEFLQAAFTMPTALFSVLLILVTLYWMSVMVGLFDTSGFDGLFDVVDGAADGLLDGALDAAGEAAGAPGERLGLLAALGAGEIPMTIPLSLLVAFAWGYSYGGMVLLAKLALAGVGGLAVVVGIGAGALGLGILTTLAAIQPLRRLVRAAPVTQRSSLVGRLCTVTTQRVDTRFGQAEVDDEGAGLLVQVRCEPPNELRRGSRALVFDYDPTHETFSITPVDDAVAPLPPSDR